VYSNTNVRKTTGKLTPADHILSATCWCERPIPTEMLCSH